MIFSILSSFCFVKRLGHTLDVETIDRQKQIHMVKDGFEFDVAFRFRNYLLPAMIETCLQLYPN